MAYPIVNIKKVWGKAQGHIVTQISTNLYEVISCESGETYFANTATGQCSCERQTWIGSRNEFVNACSHMQAALDTNQRIKEGEALTPRAESEDTSRLHRKEVAFGDGVKFTARKTESVRPRSLSHLSIEELEADIFG